MSAKLMGQVWELKLPANQQTVLLALADHATDNGGSVYPSIEYLAWKVGCSERTVQRLLRALEDAEIIEAIHGHAVGRGHKTEYCIHLDNGDKKSPFNAPKTRQSDTFIKGDNLSKGDSGDVEKVTPVTLKGDKRDSDGTVRAGAEPSENHQLEPSEEYARHAEAENSSPTSPQNPREMFDLNGGPDWRYETAHYFALLDACDLADSRLKAIPKRRALCAGIAVTLSEEFTPEEIARARLNWTMPTAPTPEQMLEKIQSLLNRKESQTNGPKQHIPARVANDDAAARRYAAKRGITVGGGGDAVPDARGPLATATNGSVPVGNGRVVDGTPRKS